jgi:hypothetical protein
MMSVAVFLADFGLSANYLAEVQLILLDFHVFS